MGLFREKDASRPYDGSASGVFHDETDLGLPRARLLYRLRCWLIRKIAGRMQVVLNMVVNLDGAALTINGRCPVFLYNSTLYGTEDRKFITTAIRVMDGPVPQDDDGG